MILNLKFIDCKIIVRFNIIKWLLSLNNLIFIRFTSFQSLTVDETNCMLFTLYCKAFEIFSWLWNIYYLRFFITITKGIFNIFECAKLCKFFVTTKFYALFFDISINNAVNSTQKCWKIFWKTNAFLIKTDF